MKNKAALLDFADIVNGVLYAGTQDADSEELVKAARKLPCVFTIGRDKKAGIKPSDSQLKVWRQVWKRYFNANINEKLTRQLCWPLA